MSILFTGGYSIRLLLLAGGRLWKGPRNSVARIKERTWLTLLPLVCLSLGSIILGFGAIGPLMSGLLLSFATMFEKSLPLVFVVVGGVCDWLLGVSHLVLYMWILTSQMMPSWYFCPSCHCLLKITITIRPESNMLKN